jgi:hypothetical protein
MPMRRSLPLLGVLALACVCATAIHAARGAVPQLLFPVVGTVAYTDDFGDPRGALRHQGNDLLGDKRAPVVAVEAGTVKYWTTSSSAGCMLYLYGESGTMYEYIHLNNDLTAKNDNKGKCVKGVSYSVADGTHVEAGEQIAYLGDSGDANGIHPHLHFEVHPNGKDAVDPYQSLQAATHLLFFAKVGTPFTLALTGTVVGTTDTTLKLQLTTLQGFPMKVSLKGLTQTLTLNVPTTATILPATSDRLLAAYDGETVTVWTQPALTTVKAMSGADGALSAALVQLGS